MQLGLLLVLAAAVVVNAAPQWPYRDNMESYYYGYQDKSNYYRAGSVEDDDEKESTKIETRQDLKVGGQSTQEAVIPLSTQPGSSASTVAGSQPVQVVETGSAKPVADSKLNQQANQPFVGQQAQQAKQPPAFPPAQQQPPVTPTDEDSDEDEDDDDDEEEADEDEEEDNEEDDDDGRRRSQPIVEEKNVTTTVNVTDAKKPEPKSKPPKKVVVSQQPHQQTVEALVPGYITDQGEVLVPFDTVVGDKNKPVAIIPDPSYEQQQPPVVVMPKTTVKEAKTVPKFFRSNPTQQYYSEVPPPGSIFTFDDDSDDTAAVKRSRQDAEESEEDDQSEEQDDDTSRSDEDDLQPSQPPLNFVKATAPSGEDDEAESLGLRPGSLRMIENYYDFPLSRSPNLIYTGNGFVVPRYGQYQQQRYYPERYSYPQYQQYGQYRPRPVQQPIYYYRPASEEKVKVIPLANFEVSLEQDQESGEVQPVVSPMRFYNKKPVSSQTPNKRVQVRPNRPSYISVYNVDSTPVVRQRTVQRRQAKDLKKKKNVKKVKQDPLGLLKRVKKE